LKFAQENGYKIIVIKGYNFTREKDVFKNYVESIYNIKSNPKNRTQKAIAKSLLNNLLGRFGISLDKAITEIMSYNTFEEKSLMNKIESYKEIDDNKVVVSYIPKLDYDIIESHDLDFLKIINKHKDKEFQYIDNTSIAISAAVTSYGRIHINKIKMYILSKGGSIYYSDTDSIVTNTKLSGIMIDNKEIGKLKLEHKVKEGIFISGKTYCLYDDQGNFINKAKGIKSNSLDYSQYLKLLNNENINTAVKTSSKID
jgi:hypothetical protein